MPAQRMLLLQTIPTPPTAKVFQNAWSALSRRNPTNLFKSNKWIFTISMLKDLVRFARFLAHLGDVLYFDTPSWVAYCT